MATILRVNAVHPEPERIERVRRRLDAGAVVGLPTDTLYGLGANALDERAVERVFAVKQRAGTQPLPVVVLDLEQARLLAARLPETFFRLAAAFWPGPLSLVVPAAARVPAQLHADTGKVAMRQPDCPILLRLMERTGYPLTATSANPSGAAPARTAAELAQALGTSVALIVDGGPAPGTAPSTLVDLCSRPPRILREGAIAPARVHAILAGEG